MSVSTASTILIVDDDDDIRESFCDVLADEGFTVEGARNGQDALDYLESHALPNLIVLDLMMPVMDGLEFRQRQLADPRWAAIRVLVMSASDRGAQIASELRVDGFLAKPARGKELIAAVSRLC
ncbi:MAG: response regulator [Deltaproteobacteria bacterium]|nr:response regulator [Deltaproteobacteria bacterium]